MVNLFKVQDNWRTNLLCLFLYTAVESLKLLVDCGKDDDEKVITGLTSLAAQVAFEVSISLWIYTNLRFLLSRSFLLFHCSRAIIV